MLILIDQEDASAERRKIIRDRRSYLPDDILCMPQPSLLRSNDDMALPPLDENGFLPVGYHDCSLDDIRETFCYSVGRQALFNLLSRYLDNWGSLGLRVPVYVDGGFATRKPQEPKDIDVVVDITQLDLRDPGVIGAVQRLLDRQAAMQSFRVDVYPYHNALVAAGSNDLRSFFSYVKAPQRLALGLKDDFRKGLLRVHT